MVPPVRKGLRAHRVHRESLVHGGLKDRRGDGSSQDFPGSLVFLEAQAQMVLLVRKAILVLLVRKVQVVMMV